MATVSAWSDRFATGAARVTGLEGAEKRALALND
jgi:hypothetical protein